MELEMSSQSHHKKHQVETRWFSTYFYSINRVFPKVESRKCRFRGVAIIWFGWYNYNVKNNPYFISFYDQEKKNDVVLNHYLSDLVNEMENKKQRIFVNKKRKNSTFYFISFDCCTYFGDFSLFLHSRICCMSIIGEDAICNTIINQ